jgi:hypothetical protein
MKRTEREFNDLGAALEGSSSSLKSCFFPISTSFLHEVPRVFIARLCVETLYPHFVRIGGRDSFQPDRQHFLHNLDLRLQDKQNMSRCLLPFWLWPGGKLSAQASFTLGHRV